MEWLQVLSLFLANAGLVIWFRTESRNDWRHMDNKLDHMHKEVQHQIQAIHDEMKDFHVKLALQDMEFKNRLCTIEERRKKE